METPDKMKDMIFDEKRPHERIFGNANMTFGFFGDELYRLDGNKWQSVSRIPIHIKHEYTGVANIIIKDCQIQYYVPMNNHLIVYYINENRWETVKYMVDDGVDNNKSLYQTILEHSNKVYVFPMTSNEIFIFDQDHKHYETHTKWKTDLIDELKKRELDFDRVKYQEVVFDSGFFYLLVATKQGDVMAVLDANTLSFVRIITFPTMGSFFGLLFYKGYILCQCITENGDFLIKIDSEKGQVVLKKEMDSLIKERVFITRSNDVIWLFQKSGDVYILNPDLCQYEKIWENHQGCVLNTISRGAALYYKGEKGYISIDTNSYDVKRIEYLAPLRYYIDSIRNR